MHHLWKVHQSITCRRYETILNNCWLVSPWRLFQASAFIKLFQILSEILLLKVYSDRGYYGNIEILHVKMYIVQCHINISFRLCVTLFCSSFSCIDWVYVWFVLVPMTTLFWYTRFSFPFYKLVFIKNRRIGLFLIYLDSRFKTLFVNEL